MTTSPHVHDGGGGKKDEVQRSHTPLEFRADGKPRFVGCSKIAAYEILGKLGEGTFGEVHKARSKRSARFVALKKILLHSEKDGFPITALREIKLLKMLSHQNVLHLEEMAVEHRRDGRKKASMYMVTPYMEHDLSGLLENPAVRITEPQIKCYMMQLLKGLEYLHAKQILHRDMKAANLLINNKGILQIADFGLARPYDDPPPQPGKGGGEASRDYTTLVVTRWYRPPELLLQLRRYTTAIDMWGVGCVFGEMFRGRPILAGKTDLNQMELICELVGSPNEANMPGFSELPGCDGVRSFGTHRGNLTVVFREQGSCMISLIGELLKLDWRKRINAMDALKHPYFTTPPLPARPGDIPQFEESHELDRRKFRDQQGPLPPAPAGGTVGMGPEGGEWGSRANGYNGGPRRPHGGHGPGRNDYDSRLPNRNGRQQERRPAWQQQVAREAGLPPRPAKDASWPESRHRGGSGRPGPDVDTYIPNYEVGGPPRKERHDRPPRYDRDDRRDRDYRDRADRTGRDRGHDHPRRRSRSPARR
jgi:serine/threonine-protein kinase BUR1